jgi:hypothetical protein
MSAFVTIHHLRSWVILVACAGMLASPVAAFARPGGGGGPGRAGGGGPGPGSRGPGDAGRGVGAPGPGTAGRGVGAPGPGVGVGGPAGVGPAAAARPGGPRDVENFIGAKPVDRTAAQTRVNSMQATLQGRTQPFTAAWYTEHPNAWQYTHPYANWWAVAGVAGVSGWLGYAAGSSTAATTTAAVASTTAAATTATAAAETAAPPADLDWMPLGVYASSPQGAAQAHVYQQLAVSRKGEIKGNYYDSVSDAVQPLAGSIDRETRKATWTVGTKGAKFATTLDALLEPSSTATMSSGAGTQTWELVQMEKPAAPKP